MRKLLVPIVISITLIGLSSCSSSSYITPTKPSPVALETDSQNQMVVKFATSSSTVKVLKVLAKAYEVKNPTVKIEFIPDSQSAGSIAALKNNIVDISGSSHKLKPEEDNGKIQYRELAEDLLMVATHNSVQGVTKLSSAQLRAIYKGNITNWKELGGPDAAIIVLDRPEDESAKELLRKYYLEKDKTTDKAIILNKEGELIDTLKSTPYAIGAFSLATSLIDQLPVNHISLNGVAPTTKNFTAGQYQMVRHLGIVWHKSPKPAAQKFVDFIFSPEGNQVLQDTGFIPVK
jgi:phosphate transport system substrate-binding protein